MRYKEYTNILKELGFRYIRPVKGSHEIWSNGLLQLTVTQRAINRLIARKELKRIGYQHWMDV